MLTCFNHNATLRTFNFFQDPHRFLTPHQNQFQALKFGLFSLPTLSTLFKSNTTTSPLLEVSAGMGQNFCELLIVPTLSISPLFALHFHLCHIFNISCFFFLNIHLYGFEVSIDFLVIFIWKILLWLRLEGRKEGRKKIELK